MKHTYYEVAKQIMEENPETRGDNTELYLSMWEKQGYSVPQSVKDFLREVKIKDSFRRAGQKVRELHPELQPCAKIQEYREEIRHFKGTEVFHKQITFLPLEENKLVYID